MPTLYQYLEIYIGSLSLKVRLYEKNFCQSDLEKDVLCKLPLYEGEIGDIPYKFSTYCVTWVDVYENELIFAIAQDYDI